MELLESSRHNSFSRRRRWTWLYCRNICKIGGGCKPNLSHWYLGPVTGTYMTDHQRTADTPAGDGRRRTSGHPGGRRTGGRYTTDGHKYSTCLRYGGRGDTEGAVLPVGESPLHITHSRYYMNVYYSRFASRNFGTWAAPRQQANFFFFGGGGSSLF